MDNKTEKSKYRAWAKDLRQKLDLKIISSLIVDKLTKLDVYRSAKTVMSYMAKDSEVSLEMAFNDASKSWFLPIVSDLKKASLLVAPFIPGKTKLIKNKFDISEPEYSENNSFDQCDKKIKLDLILIPGLCFDKEGNRLGFGAGYYDKFLSLNPESFKIGFCPKDCLVDKLPIDPWDCRVDLVITD